MLTKYRALWHLIPRSRLFTLEAIPSENYFPVIEWNPAWLPHRYGFPCTPTTGIHSPAFFDVGPQTSLWFCL